jgi:hypothetical protein
MNDQVVINIWKPNYKFKYLQGHISLSILDPETSDCKLHISWCPKDEDNITHLNPSCPPELLSSLAQDEEWESQAVDMQYMIAGLETQSILAWWEAFLSTDPDYNLYTTNCCTVIHTALRKGGIYDRLSPTNREQFASVNIWTPWLIYQLAKGVGQQIKGDDWEFLYPINHNSDQSPAVCWQRGSFHMVFQADDGSHNISVISSPDGVIWGYLATLGQLTSHAPAICSFQGGLYIALKQHSSQQIWVCPSTAINPELTISWGESICVENALTAGSPAICAHETEGNRTEDNGADSHGEQLYIAYQAANHQDIVISSSLDGVHWSSSIKTGQLTSEAPSICSFRGKLYIAFKQYGTDRLSVCSAIDPTASPDPTTGLWENSLLIEDEIEGSPSICVHNNRLYVAYKTSGAEGIGLISSEDGINWNDHQNTSIKAIGSPCLSSAITDLCLAFRAAHTENSHTQNSIMLASYIPQPSP